MLWGAYIMNNEIKSFIDDEYKNIYANLNVNWLKGFKRKIEEVSHKGLANSGVEQNILTNYAVELVNNVNEKIKDLLKDSQEKFNFVMQSNDIEDYINKSINNSNGHLEKMQKDLIDYFDNKKMPLAESCKIQLRNAKLNNKAALDKIKKEMILINKSKQEIEKKASQKIFSKGDIIGIISIVVAIILFILDLIFA